jgi:hypothetical protein
VDRRVRPGRGIGAKVVTAVRYEDGPSAEAVIHIAAPPQRVWPLVSDICVPVRFSSELLAAQWVGEAAGPCVGARFTGRNHHPAIGTWETTSVVAECDPDRCFAWNVETADGIAASWRFELEPEGSGTRLRQWARMGPAPSGINIAINAMPDKEERIIARRLAEWQRNILANLEGIKALAESTA